MVRCVNLSSSMPFTLRDRVVVLTGAASGIGAALAEGLAARGAKLALIDQQAFPLERLANKLRAQGIQVNHYSVDITDQEAIGDLPRCIRLDLGPAAVLINNAGIALRGTFAQVTSLQFDRVMDVNFHATVSMTRVFLPQLRANTPAQIVNLSSLFGIIGMPGNTAYCASKFAVRGFSEALRSELNGTDVGITVVHPGGVRTDIARSSAIGPGVNPQALPAMAARADKFLRLEPQKAAALIIKGVLQRRKRILIGTDARALTFLQRLFPVAYSRIFSGS
jgi:short-subunit dehydrogenase